MFSFPPTTGMFRFVGFASAIADAMPAHGGLPHSDTHGSKAVRASPWTFAACRVLRRLREPRHPPYALARFSLSLVTRRASPRASFARVSFCLCVCFRFPILSKNRAGHRPALVENVGLEPTTPGLQSRCSSQLSQSPRCQCVVPGRLELPTPTLSVWCSNRLSYGTPSPASRGRDLTRASRFKSYRPAPRNRSGSSSQLPVCSFQLALNCQLITDN